MGVTEAGALDATVVLGALDTGADWPPPRRPAAGRSTAPTRSAPTARALGVLGHQMRSALLVLLKVTAVASFVLGQRTDAVIIGIILAASIGLGFADEYRAERAAEALTHVSIPQDRGRRRGHQHRLARRAARFSLAGPLPQRDSSA